MIVAGDVGGTKTNIALFRPGDDGRPEIEAQSSFHSGEFGGLASVVQAFLDEVGRLAGDLRIGCFGVAGPVVGNASKTTNLPWEIDGDEVAETVGLPRVVLINDLVANAESLPLLGPEELAVLQTGEADEGGNRVLVAAGTGLGMALVPRVGERHFVVASEGGHADFAPRNDEEAALQRFLAARHGHVSVERVVSGPGLLAIYEHLRDAGAAPVEARVERRLASSDDPPSVVSEEGLAGRCRLCEEALDLFVACYGAVAGNLALIGLAGGGVYLGGGIAPKILDKLTGGGFLESFSAKGRFREMLESMPVRVILNPEAALLGAAYRGARELGEQRDRATPGG